MLISCAVAAEMATSAEPKGLSSEEDSELDAMAERRWGREKGAEAELGFSGEWYHERACRATRMY